MVLGLCRKSVVGCATTALLLSIVALDAIAQPSNQRASNANGTTDANEPANTTANGLRGSVVDAKTGTVVIGAVVASGANETATGDDGAFELPGVGRGWIDVLVIADGYEPLVTRVRAGQPAIMRLVASDDNISEQELIKIEGKRVLQAQPQSVDVSGDAVRTLPGSGNDALKALQSLPGVSRVPFGLGGLVLRGFAPRDTNVFLDGIEVPILYHFGGLASFLPSTMIDSMELIGSGYGARYGRGQGGLVDIRSKSGEVDEWRVGTEMSLLDASARANGPAQGGNLSVGVRRSFIDAVLQAVPTNDLTIAPRYLDAQMRWESKSRRWTALLFGADDGINLGTGDANLNLRQSFIRAGVRYARKMDEWQLTAVPWLGFDRTAVITRQNRVIRNNLTAALRGTAERKLHHGQLAFGIDSQANRYGYELATSPPDLPPGVMPPPQRLTGTVFASDVGAWVEYGHRFANDQFVVTPSLRAERYGLSNEVVVDPRLTLRQQLTPKVWLTQSLGRYSQPILATSLDYQLPDAPMKSSYAIQASAAVTVVSSKLGGDINVNGFAGKLYDLPVDVVSAATPVASPGSAASGGVAAVSREFTEEQLGRYSYQTSRGRGRTYGIEAMVRKRIGRVQGWLAYTFARSFREGDPWSQGKYVPYLLDQPHVFTGLFSTVVAKKWRVGARFRYATGNPVTPTTGAIFNTSEQQYSPITGQVLAERLPAFAQLDVRIDRTWVRKWGTLKLFVDIQNVSNRVNPEGRQYNFDYSSFEYTRGLPIFPAIGFEYNE